MNDDLALFNSHSFSFRIGLLGFAGNTMIREDNKAAGDEGVGNYGLSCQSSRTCLIR